MSYSIQQPTDGSFKIVETLSGNTVLHLDSQTKVVNTKVASLARTDTSAKNLFTLEPNEIPVRISVYSGTAVSNPSTATISVGKTGTNTYFVSALDVKGASGQIPCAAATHLGAAVSTSAVTQVVGIYAETGTASSAGGPFVVVMDTYFA